MNLSINVQTGKNPFSVSLSAGTHFLSPTNRYVFADPTDGDVNIYLPKGTTVIEQAVKNGNTLCFGNLNVTVVKDSPNKVNLYTIDEDVFTGGLTSAVMDGVSGNSLYFRLSADNLWMKLVPSTK
jgi:spore coat protein U-like protein